MAVWPFIVLSHSQLRQDAVFINHEKIHLRQQVELLLVFFYLWYGLEFLLRWLKYGNRRKAYLNISFEREAYWHEGHFDYLKYRRIFGFLKFI